MTDLLKRLFADEVGRHIKIDQPIETELEGIRRGIHIGMIREHSALYASDRGGMSRFESQRTANGHQLLPQRFTLGAIEQIQFIA